MKGWDALFPSANCHSTCLICFYFISQHLQIVIVSEIMMMILNTPTVADGIYSAKDPYSKVKVSLHQQSSEHSIWSCYHSKTDFSSLRKSPYTSVWTYSLDLLMLNWLMDRGEERVSFLTSAVEEVGWCSETLTRTGITSNHKHIGDLVHLFLAPKCPIRTWELHSS